MTFKQPVDMMDIIMDVTFAVGPLAQSSRRTAPN